MANDYKVLYRKYRPTSFDEVIGQKYTISMLKNAVMQNKISHAYIFTGPRGTGKTSTAKIFAKTINCENPKDGIPCEKCDSCLNIHNNADIIEIDAASNNGVDEVRELINNVKIAPSMAKYKVYIIDEVHMLSQSAFNALLLTLEEPPSHIVFILATTNIESVPITILSRCQRYDFKKIDFDDLTAHIKNVCEKEKITITDEAIEEIAYLSEGGCRDALSILNQLSTSNDNIDINVVLKNYGSVSFVQIKNIISAFLEDNFDNLDEIFKNLRQSSIDYKVFLKKTIDLLFKEAIQLKSSYQDSNFLKIKDVIFELNDLINKINITIDPFLLIYLIFIGNMKKKGNPNNSLKNEIKKEVEIQPVLESKNNNSVEEKIKNDEKVEKSIIESKNVSKVDEKYNQFLIKLQEIRLNNCFAEADKSLLKKSKENWQRFIEKVESVNVIKSSIMDSDVVLASNQVNIVVHLQPSMVEIFNENLELIEKDYNEIIGESIHFIALSSDMWENSKNEYVKRLKEHYVYTLIDEPVYNKEEVSNSSESKEEKSDSLTEIYDIFDKDKIEVQ